MDQIEYERGYRSGLKDGRKMMSEEVSPPEIKSVQFELRRFPEWGVAICRNLRDEHRLGAWMQCDNCQKARQLFAIWEKNIREGFIAP